MLAGPPKETAMPPTPQHKAERLRELHLADGCFVIANAWDAGSAKALAGLGFAALATSSGAAAGVLGRKDGEITRAEAIAHARAIVDAVELPVSADLENGFGDEPEACARTIREAGAIGLAGGSIEDCGGVARRTIYPFALAVERIAAAAEAARALPYPFVLTARCENLLRGVPDLDDTIVRLQAYAKAGADVLFAPALPDLDAVRTLCAAVDKPVNFMVGIKGRSFSVADLRAAGVKRISLATSLYRAAMAGMLQAAREVQEQGSFGYVERL
jgi:2-methylisocitrate lyase-like PEP mutase family enzyme